MWAGFLDYFLIQIEGKRSRIYRHFAELGPGFGFL
jgi:hypothetical protein